MQRATIGLGVTIAASAGVVALVHYQQKEESWKLHQGVVKDAKRIKWRKAEIAKAEREKEGAQLGGANQPTATGG